MSPLIGSLIGLSLQLRSPHTKHASSRSQVPPFRMVEEVGEYEYEPNHGLERRGLENTSEKPTVLDPYIRDLNRMIRTS